MTVQLTIIDDKNNPKRFFPERLAKGMRKASAAQMKKAMRVTHTQISKSVRTKFKGKGSELAGSFQERIKVKEGGIVVEAIVGSDLVFARVQDLGTKILPGGAIRAKAPLKRLAIPLDSTERKGGIWPRHYSGELDLIIANNKALLVDVATGEPKYILVYETKFKGKFYIAHAMMTVTPKLESVFQSVFDVAIQRFGGSRR